MRHIKELQCPYCHKNVYGGNKGLYKLICPTCNSDQPVPSMYKPVVNFTCVSAKIIFVKKVCGRSNIFVLSEICVAKSLLSVMIVEKCGR